MTDPDSTVVLTEDYVEDPVESVLDAPVPSDKARHLRRRPRVARQEVVAGTRPLPSYLPLPVKPDQFYSEARSGFGENPPFLAVTFPRVMVTLSFNSIC